MKAKGLKSLGLNFGLVILIALPTLAAIAAGEYALKVLRPTSRPYPEILSVKGPTQPLVRSSYLPFTTPAGTIYRQSTNEFDVSYTFNPLGYRGIFPRSISKEPGVRRIIFCGDSFTLGWGNNDDETFVNTVSLEINRDRQDELEVINAGYHGGYSPDSYLAYLSREGVKLDPDMVAVVLYPDNDLEDIDSNIWTRTDEKGYPVSLDTRRNYTDYQGDFLHGREELLSWNYHVPILNRSRIFTATANLFNRAIDSIRSQFPGSPAAVSADAWDRMQISIRGLNEFAHAKKIHLVYILIPARDHAISPERRNKFNRVKKLIEEASPNPALDLSPYLKQAHYFRRDAHFNAAGNREAGRHISEFISPLLNAVRPSAEQGP